MTLRYIYGQDRNVARFVAQLIPHIDPAGFPDNASAIGVVNDNNDPVAGVVFFNHNRRAGTIEIAGAARTGRFWFSRETMWHVFHHAFVGRECQLVIMRVRADNRSLLRQMHAFGCELITVPRLYGRDTDGVLCTYTAEAWWQSRYYTSKLPKQEAA